MRRLILKLLRRRRMERDLEAELAFHREMAAAHDNPVPLGNAAAIKDASRDLWLEVETMFSSIGMAFLPSQLGAAVMGALGALGLLLSAVGLYGVLAYTVARRTREFGIRMAVGARPREIARIVLAGAARLLGAGVALGLAIALFATRPLAMFFVPGLSPTDPTAFAAVTAVLAAVAAAAVIGPVWRATSVDAARCLRED